MYNFELDTWSEVERAPVHFIQTNVAFVTVGQGIYTFGDVDVCCYVYEYGRGWIKIDHEGKMTSGWGTMMLI